MAKKFRILVFMSLLLLLPACTANSTPNTPSKLGLEINSINSSIGAIGENTKDIETQSFKYTVTLTNNEPTDITIVSVNPVLSEKFLERVSNKDTVVKVNKTISKGGSLNVTGEIIFDAKGLTKEQIVSLQPFVKDVKILEERVINKSF